MHNRQESHHVAIREASSTRNIYPNEDDERKREDVVAQDLMYALKHPEDELPRTPNCGGKRNDQS